MSQYWRIKERLGLGRGKTKTHCAGKIVSCDVARPWQNAATLLRAARPQEMFLKIFRNIFCAQDTKFVSFTNGASVAKRVNISETWSREQYCRHNVSSFCRPLGVGMGLRNSKMCARPVPVQGEELPQLHFAKTLATAQAADVAHRQGWVHSLAAQLRQGGLLSSCVLLPIVWKRR